MPIINSLAERADEIAEWRRDLHMHPELQYDVHRTAASVADRLKSFGCDEIVTGIGRTGVVGVIRGRNTGKKVIGLRADMDALPIEEETGLAYASKTPGKMHACGHDGHTAMLLGAARHLCETRNFGGTAVVIFQPAEEGGARLARASSLAPKKAALARRRCSMTDSPIGSTSMNSTACTTIRVCPSAPSPRA